MSAPVLDPIRTPTAPIPGGVRDGIVTTVIVWLVGFGCSQWAGLCETMGGNAAIAGVFAGILDGLVTYVRKRMADKKASG